MARTYSWNAYETKLTSDITDSSTTISVETTIGLQGPGYLVLAPEDPANREYILFATVVNGTTLDLSPLGRGLDGSTAGAQPHDSGTILRAVSMAQMFDDLWEAILPPNGVGQELQDHIDDPGDPHSLASYMKLSEATSLFVDRAGDSMTGFLTLHADPIADMYPATKIYVDAIDPTGKYLLLTGGTVTGDLHLNKGFFIFPSADFPIGPQTYLLNYNSSTQQVSRIRADEFADAVHTHAYLPLAGGTVTGRLTLTGQTDALTLDRADSSVGEWHLGDNSVGQLYFRADGVPVLGMSTASIYAHTHLDMNQNRVVDMAAPSSATDAATKKYVDDSIAGIPVADISGATGGSSTATPTGSVTGTGWTKVHTFVVNPPNEWGTARIVVRGVWHGAGVADGNMQLQAHLNIGGNAGIDVLGGVAVPGDDPTLSMVHTFDTAADPVDVDVYVRDIQSNSGTVTNRYVDINYALYRVS